MALRDKVFIVCYLLWLFDSNFLLLTSPCGSFQVCIEFLEAVMITMEYSIFPLSSIIIATPQDHILSQCMQYLSRLVSLSGLAVSSFK